MAVGPPRRGRGGGERPVPPDEVAAAPPRTTPYPPATATGCPVWVTAVRYGRGGARRFPLGDPRRGRCAHTPPASLPLRGGACQPDTAAAAARATPPPPSLPPLDRPLPRLQTQSRQRRPRVGVGGRAARSGAAVSACPAGGGVPPAASLFPRSSQRYGHRWRITNASGEGTTLCCLPRLPLDCPARELFCSQRVLLPLPRCLSHLTPQVPDPHAAFSACPTRVVQRLPRPPLPARCFFCFTRLPLRPSRPHLLAQCQRWWLYLPCPKAPSLTAALSSPLVDL